MKIKVCGLNNKDNIVQLQDLGLDFMGFIFYERSKRSVPQGNIDGDFVKSLSGVKKVGVFVNESLETILERAEEYDLDYIQLHGEETPDFCEKVRRQGLKVVKAISISNILPIEALKSYEHVVDLFLFDTSGKERGGNGTKFDWQVLNEYQFKVPFLLAGGISLEDASDIKRLKIKMFHGVDLNSKFELAPGVKNANQVKQFIENIK